MHLLYKGDIMSFRSKYAHLIWDRLYDCLIPDHVTLHPEYLKRFGTYVTGDKNIDTMVANNFTRVKINVATILTYFEDGVEVQITSREDMIQMHRDIEAYLAEWQEHLKYDINLSVHEHKDMLLSLEKLSKEIYRKAAPREVIDNLFTKKDLGLGLMNPLQAIQEQRKEVSKPDYQGISQLIRSKTKTPQGRF